SFLKGVKSDSSRLTTPTPPPDSILRLTKKCQGPHVATAGTILALQLDRLVSSTVFARDTLQGHIEPPAVVRAELDGMDDGSAVVETIQAPDMFRPEIVGVCEEEHHVGTRGEPERLGEGQVMVGPSFRRPRD